jgi:hypothetical protein
MKTNLHYLSRNAQALWHRQTPEQLKHLHSLTTLTAAEVVLEHEPPAQPTFCVRLRQEVRGKGQPASATRETRSATLLLEVPARHAEARDSTFEAALLETARYLERLVQARQLPRLKPGQCKRQPDAVSNRWTQARGGCRD